LDDVGGIRVPPAHYGVVARGRTVGGARGRRARSALSPVGGFRPRVGAMEAHCYNAGLVRLME